MALIDTFLKLMLEKRAERLVLVSDAVPFLLKAGETIELSMPPLRNDMLQRLRRELAGADPSTDPGETPPEGLFEAADGAEFGYHVAATGPDCRIEIHTLTAPPLPDPAEDDLLRSTMDGLAKPPETAPAIPWTRTQPDPLLLAVLDRALSTGASDIFLSSGKPPHLRSNGILTRLDAAPPDTSTLLGLLPDEASRQEFEQCGNTDFAVRWELPEGGRRFRVNLFRHLGGVAAALRPVRTRIPSLSELGLPESLLELTSLPGGLVLVTGTSGSGKSTTVAALVDHVNRTQARHVITIEDPVEFEHREVRCLIHQREVGSDVESFSSGLRAALRENPDVILLGEIRDLATISAALTAAETGHLVFATLHSGSASSAVNRIVDVFPGHQQAFVRAQLSASLRAVVSQRLVVSRSRQLVPALEKLLVTPAVANGIREGHEHYLRNAMLTGGEDGMITLERSLANLVRKGTIDRETAMHHAMDQKALLHLLG